MKFMSIKFKRNNTIDNNVIKIILVLNDFVLKLYTILKVRIVNSNNVENFIIYKNIVFFIVLNILIYS